MIVLLNTAAIDINEHCTLDHVLSEHGYGSGCFAVAVNKSFVPRHDFIHTSLKDGDVIDVVMPMQGG